MPLYAVKRPSPGKLVDHAGVLVVGNVLGLLGAGDLFQDPSPMGVVVHLTPQGIETEALNDLGPWAVERIMADEAGARLRLGLVLQSMPGYDAFARNCEHFVSFIETGEATSPQLRGIATLVGVGALLWWLGGSGEAGRSSR